MPAVADRRGLSTPDETESHRDAQGSRVQQLPVARFGKPPCFILNLSSDVDKKTIELSILMEKSLKTTMKIQILDIQIIEKLL